jgi:regulator of replication initiation timing
MFIERGEERGVKENKGIKDAFERVKNDIFSLGNEISSIKSDISDLKNQISSLLNSINNLNLEFFSLNSAFQSQKNQEKQEKSEKKPEFYAENLLINPTDVPTHIKNIPTHSPTPTDNPTLPLEVRGLKYQNFDTWTGNGGVPTDRQTNQQTDIPTDIIEENPYNEGKENFQREEAIRHYKNPYSDQEISSKQEFLPEIPPQVQPKTLSQNLKDASQIIDSLDDIKKEIRLKIKAMTSQEMLVFSTIYQLEQQFPEGVEYKHIASRLKLSESSIRDYTQKLISKGIPVEKLKLNNKKILLRISSELKEIAPLSTILKLRDI